VELERTPDQGATERPDGVRTVVRVKYVPAIAQLQGAIREDIRALPYSMARHQVTELTANTAIGTEAKAEAVFGLALLHFLRNVGNGTDVLEALVSSHDPLVPAVQRHLVEGESLIQHLSRLQTLAAAAREARRELSSGWSGAARQDSLALYAIRTLLVNGGRAGGYQLPDADWRQKAPQLLASTQELLHMSRYVQAAWDTLRSLPADSSGLPPRLALLNQILQNAGEVAFSDHLAGLDPRLGPQLAEIRVAARSALDVVTYLQARDYPAAIRASQSWLARAARGSRLEGEQIRLMSFTADIAVSREPEDIRFAFERLVGGGSGYLGKRSSQRAFWRLNAYPGMAAGLEYLASTPDSVPAWGGVAGIALPVGIEYGWPTSGRSSNSVFLQLVDLGAVASARISSGGTETFPEFSFSSVLAPGVFWVHGFRNSVFSSRVGGVVAPRARISRDGNRFDGLRLSFGVGVDVPLFP
jgi:hypothetical protein